MRNRSIRNRAGLLAAVLFLTLTGVGWFAYVVLNRKPDAAGELKHLMSRLEKEPRNDSLRLRIVNLHMANGQFKRASAQLEFLLKNHPGNKKLLLRMVVLQYRLKDYQQALLWMERLKRLDPNSFNLLKIEGDIWRAYGNLDECEKSWLSAYHLKPSEVSHAFNLVDLLVEQRRLVDAEKILRNTFSVVRTKQERRMVTKKLEQIRTIK